MAKKDGVSGYSIRPIETKKPSLVGSSQNLPPNYSIRPVSSQVADLPIIRPEETFEPQVDTGWFDGINDDEETLVQGMVNSGQWTPAEGDLARKVMKGETTEQQNVKKESWKEYGKSWAKMAVAPFLMDLTPDKIVAPFVAHKMYYFDANNKGLPKAVSPGEKIPVNAKIESLWGNDLSSGDDHAITTFVKGLSNTLMKDILTIGPNLKAGFEGLVTGKRGDAIKQSEWADKIGDAISTELSPDARQSLLTDEFKGISDLFNSKAYNFTGQNVAKLAGNVIGSLIEFGAIGKAVGAGAKTTSIAGKTVAGIGAGSLVSFNETYRDAMLNAPQVNPRAAAAMAFTNAIAYGALERLGGIDELRFLGGMQKTGAFTSSANAIKGVLKETGGEINEEFFKKAFGAALKTQVKFLPRVSKFLKTTGVEAFEETAQTFWTKATEELYDTLAETDTSKQYGTKVGSVDSMKEYFESAIGGAIGGLFGGVRESVGKQNEQQKSIFDYIKKGKKVELKKDLYELSRKGKYSEQQLQQTSAIIDAYDDFYSQIKDNKLPDDKALELLQNAFQARYMDEKIKNAEADETKGPIIKKAEIDALNKQKKDFEKKITEILYKNEKEKENPVEESVEEQEPYEEEPMTQEQLQDQYDEEVLAQKETQEQYDEELEPVKIELKSEKEPSSLTFKSNREETLEQKAKKEKIQKESEIEFRKELEEKPEEKEKEYFELTKGKRLFNTDIARRLFKKYTDSPETMVQATQLPAREFVTKLFNKEIEKPAPKGRENAVLFTSGGSGVGKSTVVSEDDSTHQAIVDTNLADFDGAVKDIDNVLSKGKRADIAFVYRDLYDSFVNGVMSRAQKEGLDFGRTIPADLVADIHEKSLAVIQKLSKHYKDNPSVKFYYFDNSHGEGKAVEISLEDVSKLKVDKEVALKKINNEIKRQYEKGEISEESYKGFKSIKGAQSGTKEEPSEERNGDKKDGGEKLGEQKTEKVKSFEEELAERELPEIVPYSYAYYKNETEKAKAKGVQMGPGLLLAQQIQQDLETGKVSPDQAQEVLNQWEEMKAYEGNPNLSDSVKQILEERIARARKAKKAEKKEGPLTGSKEEFMEQREKEAEAERSKAEKSKIDRLIDDLENLKIKGKDAKSILPPFNMFPAVWNGALTVIQTGLKAGKLASEIIKDIIAYFKREDPKWWNKLSKEDKSAVLNQFSGHMGLLEEEMRLAVEGETEEIREAAKEVVKASLEITDEDLEGVLEEHKSIRFEKEQFEGMEKKLRHLYTDPTGEKNIPTEGIAKKFLFYLFQGNDNLQGDNIKENLKNVASEQTDEQLKNLLNYVASNKADTIRSLAKHFSSSRIAEYVYFANRGGKQWKMFISNKAVEDKELTIELREKFEQLIEEKGKGYDAFVEEEYQQYLSDRNRIWNVLNAEINKPFELDKKRVSYKSLADRYAHLSKIANLSEPQKDELTEVTKQLEDKGGSVLYKRKDGTSLTINRLISEYSMREAAFISKVSGIEQSYWDQYQEFNAVKSKYLNATDSIIRNLKFSKPGLSISQFIIRPVTEDNGATINADKFKSVMTEGKYGSQFQSISRIVTAGQKDVGPLDTFHNVSGKLKNSYLYISSALKNIEKLNTSEVQNNRRLINNPFVQHFKNHIPKKFFVDGLKNETIDKNSASDSLSDWDMSVILALGFLDGHLMSGKGTYLQPIEKFSDKAQELLIETPQYSTDEAKSMFKEIPADQKPSNEEMAKEVEFWQDRIGDFIADGVVPASINRNAVAEQYVYNYAVNKHYIDLYFQGNASNYTKSGKDDYITRVKRQDLSNGIVGDTEVTGGIGKNHYHMTMNDPKVVVEIGKHVFGGKNGEGVEIPDGFQIAFEEWGQKMNKSYGSIFDVKAILKTFYSKVNDDGSRLLLKGNTLVLPDSFVYEKDSSGDYIRPILAKLRDYSKKDHIYEGKKVKISVFSFESSSKIRPKSGENKIDWFGYTNVMNLPDSPNIMEIDNEYYLYQQNLNQNLAPKPGSLTKQLLRFAMDFKNGVEIQKHFNDAIQLASADLKNELQLMDDATRRKFFLENIEESPNNYTILSLLKNEKITLDSPLLSGYLDSVMGSIIERKVLSPTANKGLLVEIPAFQELQEMKPLEDTIQSAGVIVPFSYKKRGFKKGDKIFVTRVPSTGHHSTSLVEIESFAPDEMGSVITLSPQIQKPAGSDNDGDARHVWSLFRDKNGNVIQLSDENKGNFRAVMNEAFRLMEEEYTNPKNFDKLVNPIDVDAVAEDVKPYKEKLEKVNKDLSSSYLKVFRSNMEAKRIIAITARFMAVHSFAKAHKFVLKDTLTFPQLDKNGAFTPKMLKDLFTDNPIQQEKIDMLLANNTNQATDNAKEQNLEAMGMSISTATLYNMFEELGVKQEHVIRFMNTSVVQDYIEQMRKISSPTFAGKRSDVFEILAKQYLKGEIPSDSVFWNKIWDKNKLPMEGDFTSKSAASQIRVLNYLQYALHVSNAYQKISSTISLVEKAPKGFGTYYAAKLLFKKMDNKSLSIRINGIEKNLNGSEYIVPVNENMALADNTYRNALINTPLGRSIMASIISDHSYFINSEGSEEFKMGEVSEEIATNIERAFKDYLSILAVAKNDNKKEIRVKADKAFHKIDKANPIRQYLNVNIETGSVAFRERYRRAKFYPSEIEELRKAFAELPQATKDILVKNQVLQYGYNLSQKIGGYALIFDEDTHADISQKITDSRSQLNSVSNAYAIKNYILLSNPALIADATWITTIDPDNLRLKAISRGEVSQYAYPEYVKKTVRKKVKIYKRTGEEPGEFKYAEERTIDPTQVSIPFVAPIVSKKGTEATPIKSQGKPTEVLKTSEAGFENEVNDFYSQFEEVSDNYYHFNTVDKIFEVVEPDAGTRSKKVKVGGLLFYIYSEGKTRHVLDPYSGYFVGSGFKTIKDAENFLNQLSPVALKNALLAIRKNTEQQKLISPKFKFSPSSEFQSISTGKQLNAKDFINYSGGAKGADTYWESVGKEFNIGKQINYRPEHIDKLTPAQAEEVEKAYIQVVYDIGRKTLGKSTFSGKLVRRDYLQAKAADAVFAISTIENNIVQGGTAYAVHSAINLGKPVYVFDQNKKKWYTWENNQFVPTETPSLTQKFSGIGTREINDAGKQAIRDVYEKTFKEGVKYQMSSAQEVLASDDPELDAYIKERLQKLFPQISLFENAEAFQAFLNKHFPGQVLNMEALGAAIGMANYINPNTAKQSTRLHETAHVYWDLLPNDTPVKVNMLALYDGNEEAVISDIGLVATDLARVSLKGGRLQKFMALLKTFWLRVKQKMGFATKEDYVRIMADDVWKNKMRVGEKAKATDQPELKYMVKSGFQKSFIENLIGAAKKFAFDEKNHSYSTVDGGMQFTSVTQSFEADGSYSFDRDDMQEQADVSTDIGTRIHKLAEAITLGVDTDTAIAQSGLKIEKEILDRFVQQLQELNRTQEKEGTVVSEVVAGATNIKLAGTIDRLVVRSDGSVDIYDFKTSQSLTTSMKYKSPMAHGKKSKFDKHGLQLALYGTILEMNDSYSGRSPAKINKTGIIPIYYKLSGENITEIQLEPMITHSASEYAKFSKEADRIIETVMEENTESDREEMSSAGIIDRVAYANARQFPLSDYEAELKAIPVKRATKEQNYRRKRLKSLLADFDKEYAKYVEDLQQMNKLSKEVDWENLSLEDAKKYYDIIAKYDNLATNIYMEKVYRVIAKRIAEEQMKVTGVKEMSEKDLHQAEVYFRALSEMSERFPQLQNIDRKWRAAYENYGRRFEAVRQDAEKLYREVQKEKMKNWSLTKKISYFLAPVKDHSIFTKNLWQKDKDILKDPTDSSLTATEKKYVEFIIEKNSEFEDLQKEGETEYQYGWLPQSNIGFFEQWNNAGLFKALATWKASNMPLDYVKIKFLHNGVTKTVTLRTAIDVIETEAGEGIVNKTRALKRISDLTGQAKKQYKTGYHSDGKKISLSEGVTGYLMENGQWVERDGFEDAKFLFSKDKSIRSKYQVRRANRGPRSKDVHRAFIEYQRDMLFVDQINPMLSDVLPIQALYQQNKKNPNVSKFLELFIHRNILQRGTIPVVGKEVDKLLYFGRMWTFFSVLAFNLPAAGFNLFIGKFQELRRGGLGELINGEKLFWGNFRKSLAILRNYRLIDDTTELNPEKDAGFYFIRFATAGTWITEYMIQGAAFINQIQKKYPEVWENFDKDGRLKNPDIRLSGEQLSELRKSVKEIQGRYNEEDKRMYANYSMWSAAMQFKTWLPDFLMDRMGKEYIDSYGVTHKGSYRSVLAGLKDAYYWISNNHDKIHIKKGDVDWNNNMKNLREMLAMAVLLSAWAAAHGDDDDKKKGDLMMKMVGDIALIFNMSNMEFLASQPMPTLGTFGKTIGAFKSLTKGEIYERQGRYGEKGDWQFPGKFLRVMPFQHALKPVFTNDKYED